MTDAVVHLPVELELMSRFLNRNFELLEPYDAKVSRTVLRGEGGSNAPDLLDNVLIDHRHRVGENSSLDCTPWFAIEQNLTRPRLIKARH